MAIARVQGNSAHFGAIASTNIATTITAVGNGNAVCGVVTWDDTSGQLLSSVTDNQGNTYNKETTVSDSVNQAVAAFSRTNITNAPVTITANFNDVTTFRTIVVDEFSGTSTVSADERDGTAHGGQNQPTPGTGTDAITSGPFTTVTNGDLLYGACVGPTTTALASNGTSFSTGTTNNTDFSTQTEWRVQTIAGAGTAATFSQAVGVMRTTFLIAVKTGTQVPVADIFAAIAPSTAIMRRVTIVSY